MYVRFGSRRVKASRTQILLDLTESTLPTVRTVPLSPTTLAAISAKWSRRAVSICQVRSSCCIVCIDDANATSAAERHQHCATAPDFLHNVSAGRISQHRASLGQEEPRILRICTRGRVEQSFNHRNAPRLLMQPTPSRARGCWIGEARV
ncbi:hypothetical protein FKP32DRAFT_987467 [Trametes sanguinea]|nr:hypothetical protein FKP32DRAFT_987467 [Trametes sanguinea]